MQKLVVIALAGLAFSVSVWAAGFDAQSFTAEMSKEKSVKDVLITDQGNIYVGMIDNGSNRDGYAMYVCEVAREHASGNVRDKIIRIIDIVKVANNKGFHDLGRAICKF